MKQLYSKVIQFKSVQNWLITVGPTYVSQMSCSLSRLCRLIDNIKRVFRTSAINTHVKYKLLRLMHVNSRTVEHRVLQGVVKFRVM